MSRVQPTTLDELMYDTEQIMVEVNRAVRDTLLIHKLLGFPVVVWRDGQVVWIPPEQIPVEGGTNGAVDLPQY